MLRVVARELLKVVDRVHDALELRLVDQIERALLAGKHLERDSPCSSDHPCRFFGRKIASSNGFERQMYQYAQAANASAFFVNLFLSGCGYTLLRGFHDWPVDAQTIMNSRESPRNSTERPWTQAFHPISGREFALEFVS